MGAHRIAVDMMDKASALPTYPQRQQQKQPTDFTIGLKASTRLHDEGQFFHGGLIFAKGHRSNSSIILVHSPNGAAVLLVWA